MGLSFVAADLALHNHLFCQSPDTNKFVLYVGSRRKLDLSGFCVRFFLSHGCSFWSGLCIGLSCITSRSSLNNMTPSISLLISFCLKRTVSFLFVFFFYIKSWCWLWGNLWVIGFECFISNIWASWELNKMQKGYLRKIKFGCVHCTFDLHLWGCMLHVIHTKGTVYMKQYSF